MSLDEGREGRIALQVVDIVDRLWRLDGLGRFAACRLDWTDLLRCMNLFMRLVAC